MRVKRKVIRQGSATLTITLPKHWATAHEIGPGDMVDVAVEPGLLTVRPAGDARPARISIHLPRAGIAGYRQFLRHAYWNAFDEVMVTYDDPAQLPDIRRVIDEIPGMEVVGRAQGRLELRTSAPDPRSYDELLGRTFRVLHAGFTCLVDALARGSSGAARLAVLYRNQLRLCNPCHRILRQQPIGSWARMHADHQLLTLNDVTLHQVLLVHGHASALRRPGAALIRYARELRAFCKGLIEAYERPAEHPLSQLLRKREYMYAVKDECLRAAAKRECTVVQELGILLRRLSDYIGPLFALRLQRPGERGDVPAAAHD